MSCNSCCCYCNLHICLATATAAVIDLDVRLATSAAAVIELDIHLTTAAATAVVIDLDIRIAPAVAAVINLDAGLATAAALSCTMPRCPVAHCAGPALIYAAPTACASTAVAAAVIYVDICSLMPLLL